MPAPDEAAIDIADATATRNTWRGLAIWNARLAVRGRNSPSFHAAAALVFGGHIVRRHRGRHRPRARGDSAAPRPVAVRRAGDGGAVGAAVGLRRAERARRLAGLRLALLLLLLLLLGGVQRGGGAHERLQGLLVQLVAFADVDGAADIALQARVNRPDGSSSAAPFAESSFTTALEAPVTDTSVLEQKFWNPAPFPFLDRFGDGVGDQGADAAEHRAARQSARRCAHRSGGQKSFAAFVI